jgi:hypothetical protein
VVASERAAVAGYADNAVVDPEGASEIMCDLLGPLAYAPAAGGADLAVGDRDGNLERHRSDADLIGERRTDRRLHELVGERRPYRGGVLKARACGEVADGLQTDSGWSALIDVTDAILDEEVPRARLRLLLNAMGNLATIAATW